MFGILQSEKRKLRRGAATWLELADRVRKFRGDLLSAAQHQRLREAAAEVRVHLDDPAGADRLEPAVTALEKVLRETGGRIYPASSLVENVEFFLVAAIVILGLRAYFLQPFKIPTNSMWPSYYGMTAESYPPGAEPGLVRRTARLFGLGASHYSVVAPADGEVLIPVVANFGFRPAFIDKPGRSLLVFPAMMREYTFSVAGEMARVAVPAEFDNDFQGVLETAFKGTSASLSLALREAADRNKPLPTSRMTMQGREVTVYWIPSGKTVRRGENILSFDILTGDLLFVDRMSYNFIPPRVGSGFVFKTGNIEALKADEGDKYFVKRLVGVPGDVLEIKAPVLYRNGRPIEGAAAFVQNARREGKYPGYTNNTGGRLSGDGLQTSDGLLPLGGTVTVPANSYFALGDNSPRSKDSRYWGFVPDKDVVGRPLFIYYPFTSRWGPAR